MASPAVVTTANNLLGTPGTSWVSCPLPASIVADNLLLTWVTVATRDAVTLGFPAGWNIIVDDIALATPATSRQVLAWKKATGAEGATMTVTNGSTSSRFNAISYQISGAADPTVQVPECATVVTGSSTSMNAGLVTPTGGSKDYLFIILTASPSASSVTVPTNYSGRITQSDGVAISIHTCSRQATVTSEDPAGWTISPTNPWMATVAAVHPPAAGGGATTPRRIWGGDFFRSSA